MIATQSSEIGVEPRRLSGLRRATCPPLPIAFGVSPNASSRRRVCQPGGLPEFSRRQRPRYQCHLSLRPGGALEHSPTDQPEVPPHSTLIRSESNLSTPSHTQYLSSLHPQKPSTPKAFGVNSLANSQSLSQKKHQKTCKKCATFAPYQGCQRYLPW